jgi:hypothetical protein
MPKSFGKLVFKPVEGRRRGPGPTVSALGQAARGDSDGGRCAAGAAVKIERRLLQETSMKSLRALLTLIAIPAGLVSAFLFSWWLFIFGSYFLHLEISNPFSDIFSAYTNSNLKAFYYLLREFFSIIAGLFGWMALIALCMCASRSWRDLPKWIPAGCLLGAAAVLVGPYHFSLAVPPISLALCLLGRAGLKET